MKRQITFWVILLCLVMAAMPAMTVCAAADDKPPVLTPPPTPVPVELEDMPEEEIWWTDMKPFRIGDFMVIIREGTIEISEYCGTDAIVVVPKEIEGLPVTAIWPEAFMSSGGTVVSVEVQAELTSIDEAFSCCQSLEAVTLPATLKTIGLDAFLGCHSLVSICIPDSVTAIEQEAFSNCDHLETVKLPEGINVIDDYTFWGCSSLTAINIPASVSSIGEEAFWGCSSLPSISIPAGVTSIAGNAFQGCDSLVIHVVSGSYAEAYCRENGMNYRVISE